MDQKYNKLSLAVFCMALSACGAGGDGDSAWRGNGNDDGETPFVEGVSVCATTANEAGINFKVCDLPEKTRLEVLHVTSSSSQPIPTVLVGTTDRTVNHSITAAKNGDLIRLGNVVVPESENYLVTCEFEKPISGTEILGNGDLRFNQDSDSGIQTVRCGKTYIIGQIYSSDVTEPDATTGGIRRVEPKAFLRVNLDTSVVDWLRDESGKMVYTDYSSGMDYIPRIYIGGRLLFKATNTPGIISDAANPETFYWSTNGVALETRILKDGIGNQPVSSIFNNIEIEPVLPSGEPQRAYYYKLDGGGTREAWATDGTSAGTLPDGLLDFNGLRDQNAEYTSVKVAGNYLYQASRTGELYRLLSMNLSTKAVQEIVAPTTDSVNITDNYTSGSFVHEGKLYFVRERDFYAPTGKISETWVTDGTPQNTRFAYKNISQNECDYAKHVLLNGNVYLPCSGQLWKINLDDFEWSMVYDPRLTSGVKGVVDLVLAKDKIFFTAITNRTGRQFNSGLFVSDGSTSGTRQVKQEVMPATHFIEGFMNYLIGLNPAGNGRVVFAGSRIGDIAHQIYTTDGTDAGTVRLFPGAEKSPIHPSADCPMSLCSVQEPYKVGEKLLFRTWTRLQQAGELKGLVTYWISDGTLLGTYQLKNTRGGAFQHPFSAVYGGTQ